VFAVWLAIRQGVSFVICTFNSNATRLFHAAQLFGATADKFCYSSWTCQKTGGQWSMSDCVRRAEASAAESGELEGRGVTASGQVLTDRRTVKVHSSYHRLRAETINFYRRWVYANLIMRREPSARGERREERRGRRDAMQRDLPCCNEWKTVRIWSVTAHYDDVTSARTTDSTDCFSALSAVS